MDFRQYLEHFGWSQAELARRIGVTPDTVSRWKGQAPQVVLMYLGELRKNEDYGDRLTARFLEQLGNVEETIGYVKLALRGES